MCNSPIRTAALLVAALACAEVASAASVTVLSQDRHVAARMIVNGQSSTQQFSVDSGDKWQKVAQVVVDDRVRSRAAEQSVVLEGPTSLTLRSKQRVGIESVLDVSPTSAVAAAAPLDPFPAAAFDGIDPFLNPSAFRLAGSAETWFDVAFRVLDTVSFKLSAWGDETLTEGQDVDARYRVTLSSQDSVLFDLNSDVVSGYASDSLDGLLNPGDYRFRIYTGIAGEDLQKARLPVDAKLVLFDLPNNNVNVAVAPTPAAVGLGLAMMVGGAMTRRRH